VDLLQTLYEPRNIKYQILLVVISIVIYSISAPGGDFPLLTFIVFVPLALILPVINPRKAAIIVYITTMCSFLSVVLSFVPSVVKFIQVNYFLGYLSVITVASIFSIPYAVIGWLISYMQWLERPFGSVYASACYVVLSTVLSKPLPGGYAHSIYEYPILIQILDIGGVPILLFFVMFVNFEIAKIIRLIKKKPSQSLKSLVILVSVISITCIYGLVKIAEQNRNQEFDTKIKIGYVQPKLERQDKLDDLYSASLDLVMENPDVDLLVWPEFSAQFSFIESLEDKKNIESLLDSIKVPIIIVSGYVYKNPSDSNSGYFNMAHLINKNGQLQESYAKQTLVPFFEYMPYFGEVSFFKNLSPGTLRYLSGQEIKTFDLDDGVRVIPLICYETDFPGNTRKFVEVGGNIIINLSNDIWLGNTKGYEYHFALGLFRSVENRVPWIRVTNSGISASVSAAGEIDKDSVIQSKVRGARVVSASIPKYRSLYSRIGDLFFSFLIVIILLGIFRNITKHSF
jgi:apolipoprotein N-acyltransferase